MPLPTQPPQQPHIANYATLRAALTPPLGLVTLKSGTLSAGPVATTTNGLGYAEGQVEYFVGNRRAGKRTFCLGTNSVINRGATFNEGLAVAFDLAPEFQRQGVARALHRHLVDTLVNAGVERILVNADRVGSAAWQRYYDWDHEQSSQNSTFLTSVLFATRPSHPMTAEQQTAWRTRATRSASPVRGIPLRMRLWPQRSWEDTYEAQERIAQHLMASRTIPKLADMEGNPGGVSTLLACTNWHGVLCLSARAADHNNALRQEVLEAVLKPRRA